jgi:hypothetical protein
VKIVLPALKPRNPVALAASKRQGGRHRPRNERQQARRVVRQQLEGG